MKKLNVGVIGLGARGYSMLPLLCGMENINIVSVCDMYHDRTEAGAALVSGSYGRPVAAYDDWHELIASKPDAVLVMSGWESHVEISIEAMRSGIPVGCEVGGAYTVEELSTGLSAERIDVLDALRSLIDAELVDYKEKETAETFERRYFWTEVEPWEVEE